MRTGVILKHEQISELTRCLGCSPVLNEATERSQTCTRTYHDDRLGGMEWKPETGMSDEDGNTYFSMA